MAAFYSSPPPVTQDYINELKAFGFDQGQITQQTNQPEQTVVVFQENWAAVMWFCETQDCYRFSESGVCLGLDLPQVVAEKELTGRETTAQDFKNLKEMARENTRLLNRSLEKQAEEIKPKYAGPPD